jgi:UDP-GlcNAc3NAcA epimerase
VKTVAVVGARPQFIKAAVVSRALSERCPDVHEVLVHTGQHYDANMSDVFFDELEIPRPDYNLGIGGGTHGQNTGRMIAGIEEVLLKETPDWVLVYGDTDSTLAGALAAVKLHLPIAHVEAGLRSFDRRMPEEVNRVLTDHVSDLLCTPTDAATRNLANEGIAGPQVVQTGDVMYDAARYYAAKAAAQSTVLERLQLTPGNYVLTTVHRAANTDDPERLRRILEGLARSPLVVVWPLHPRARQQLVSHGLRIPPSVMAIEPVGYLDMTMLEANACLIATDSGGVQKEAYFHRVPCLTLRSETEWVELVSTGWNVLVPSLVADLGQEVSRARIKPAEHPELFGTGDAGGHVVRLLKACHPTAPRSR